MAGFFVSLGMIAPYYNLVFIIIAILLFIMLFRTEKSKAFMRPWYLIFVCLLLFVLETVLTVLRGAGFFKFIPQFTNAFWELGIITLFIYAILLQKEYVKKELSIID